MAESQSQSLLLLLLLVTKTSPADYNQCFSALASTTVTAAHSLLSPLVLTLSQPLGFTEFHTLIVFLQYFNTTSTLSNQYEWNAESNRMTPLPVQLFVNTYKSKQEQV